MRGISFTGSTRRSGGSRCGERSTTRLSGGPSLSGRGHRSCRATSPKRLTCGPQRASFALTATTLPAITSSPGDGSWAAASTARSAGRASPPIQRRRAYATSRLRLSSRILGGHWSLPTGPASSARFAGSSVAPGTAIAAPPTNCCSSSSSPWERMERILSEENFMRSNADKTFRAQAWRPALRLLLGLAIAMGSQAAGKLNVMTATEDLAAIAREAGGDQVNAESIARGYQDPHFVEPKPSFILKLQKADLLVVVGLDLEIGWLPPLITQSRNGKIQKGNPGYLDASNYCEILEKPTGAVSRAMGDVHPLGNPHYWLDPQNGRRIAKALADKFSQMQPAGASTFAARYTDFDKRLTEAEKGWQAKMAPYRGRKVITYHRSWPNFCERFGLNVVDYVEPKPGIPPTPNHTLDVINLMKRDNIKLILVEPYFDLRAPNKIAQDTGGQVVVLMPSVGGAKEITNYFQLFDYDINLLVNAFQKLK